VHAVVVLKSEHTVAAEELITHCRQCIAGYKVPRSVEFTQALPRSGAGKILKAELRQKFWVGEA
jgi:acyl-CoA synthetase (AMP-forming)/AMP-acid ligase II